MIVILSTQSPAVADEPRAVAVLGENEAPESTIPTTVPLGTLPPRELAADLLTTEVAADAPAVGAQEDEPRGEVPLSPAAVAAETRRLNELVTQRLGELNRTVEEYGTARDALISQSNALRAERAQMYVPKEAFMQSPSDPNFPNTLETDPRDTNLGAGVRVPGTGLIFRSALAGVIQSWYDTGVVGSGENFDPSTIASGGSSALGAGQFDMVEFKGQLKLDLEVPITKWEQAQAYLDTTFNGGDLAVRQAFGRAALTNVNVLAGSYWTAWADEGTLPKSLNGNNSYPSGSHSSASIPQLRFAIPSQSGWIASVAIQKPLPGPMDLVAADEQVIHRFPDLAARVRFFDGDYMSFSVGGFASVLGRDNVNSGTSFKGGWGLSSSTRFRLSDDSALMAGIVGGKGISGSIFGLSDAFAAGTQADGSFVTLGSVGTYVGVQHEWSEFLFSTAAYGFAGSEAFKTVSSTRSHNVWVNTVYQITKDFTAGVQYDYGSHIGKNGSGDDHRVTLIVAVTTGVKDNIGGTSGSGSANMDPGSTYSPQMGAMASPDSQPNAFLPQGPAIPSNSFVPLNNGISRFPRM